MNRTEAPHVHVVEASAGSGKTYELARRYIRTLLSPSGDPGSMARATLAITFTNKAAVEMKERILDLLKKLALGDFRDPGEKKGLLDFLEMGEKEARAAARSALDTIIRNYNFFQVQTIDSFINAILSGCAFRLELSADFRIRDDFSRYISYGLDSLVQKASADPAVRGLFLDFLHQYIFLENQAGWFPGKDLLETVSRMFIDSNAYDGRFVSHPVPSEALYAKRREIVALMEQLRDARPDGANRTSFNSFLRRLEKHARELNIDELCKPFCAPELPLRKGADAPEEVLELWRRIRREIGALFEMESLSLFNCYIGIFEKVNAEIVRQAEEENLLFLPELNRRARALFEEGITVPELYYRLATRFRHYLIDEFQDTSSLQWRNLFLMVQEALSTGGSLFYVGDKKQAIFRFRGGDASLFRSVKEEFAQFGVRTDILSANRRSRREIVDFNNAVFSQENLRRFLDETRTREEEKDSPFSMSASDCADILSIFEGATQNSVPGPGGCVRIMPVRQEEGADEEELVRAKLVSLLKELRTRRGSWREIAVLSRANADIEKMTSWLLEAGIPVESEKTLNAREHPLIKEIVSLLEFLNSPIDELAFASFILGDIFTRAAGLPRKTFEDFLFRRQRDRTSRSYLYRDFRLAFPELWESLLDELFRNVGFVPLYELVISVFARFRVHEGFPGCQGFLMKFLELVRRQVSEENADCAAFLEYFEKAPDEELYVNVTGTDAVRLMSIHKAKGLGFDTVVIPFLEISPDSGTGGGRPYMVDPESAEGIRLLRISRHQLAFSPLLSRLFAAEYKRSLVDELNTVYVALTRASSELYAFLPQKSGKGQNLCHLLIPPEWYSLGEPPPAPKTARPVSQLLLESPCYKSWIPYLREEFIDKQRLLHREQILDGTVMHQALSSIGNLKGRDVADAVREAIAACRSAFPLYPHFDRVEEKLLRICGAVHLREFFLVEDGEIWCERELARADGTAARIDRAVRSGGRIKLIDYKSSRKEREEGLAQLASYRRLLAELTGEEGPAYLLYLDTLELEALDGTG